MSKNYKGLSIVFFKIFDGNTDQNTVVNHKLKHSIIARYIRIVPVDYHNFISLRAEFYGCRSGKYSKALAALRPVFGSWIWRNALWNFKE